MTSVQGPRRDTCPTHHFGTASGFPVAVIKDAFVIRDAAAFDMRERSILRKQALHGERKSGHRRTCAQKLSTVRHCISSSYARAIGLRLFCTTINKSRVAILGQ
jgi:hypothetical protein